MKTKKFLFLSALFLGLSQFTNVQAQSDSVVYNREFGFGTNIVLIGIFNSSNSPLDFMYRWKSGDGYLRLGTHLNYSNNRDSYSNLSSEYSDETFNLGVNVGKEWRAEISDRWLLNYGADLNLSYSKRVFERTNKQDEDRVSFSADTDERFGPGIQPFIGIMFKINQRLLLGTEASFLISAHRYFEKSESFVEENGVISNDYPNHDNKTGGWNFHLQTQQARNIFLYYRF